MRRTTSKHSLASIRYTLMVHSLPTDEDAAVTDFLDQKRKEITERLDELRPVVDEYKRLEAATAALEGIPAPRNEASASRGSTVRQRGPGRPRGSKTRATAASPTSAPAAKPTSGRRRAGRRKGKASGARAAAALALVGERPGITIPELAAEMAIKQNYLYRVLPRLEQEGQVVKQGRGWHPVEKTNAAAR
jgi:hypothetical protein